MAGTEDILASLIDEWRSAPVVLALERALLEELAAGTEPFAGRPLPDELVRGRLPEPIRSAWVFVLRPRTRNPAHVHPGSTQHTAVIRGGGTCISGDRAVVLETFDRARAARTILVFPAGTPHSFEPGAEPLVVSPSTRWARRSWSRSRSTATRRGRTWALRGPASAVSHDFAAYVGPSLAPASLRLLRGLSR